MDNPKNPVVNKDLCIGCGSCTALCSQTFNMGADGKSEVVNPQGNSQEEIKQAVDSCPVQAISLE